MRPTGILVAALDGGDRISLRSASNAGRRDEGGAVACIMCLSIKHGPLLLSCPQRFCAPRQMSSLEPPAHSSEASPIGCVRCVSVFPLYERLSSSPSAACLLQIPRYTSETAGRAIILFSNIPVADRLYVGSRDRIHE